MREEKRHRNLTYGTASKAGQPVIERLPDSRRKYSPQDRTAVGRMRRDREGTDASLLPLSETCTQINRVVHRATVSFTSKRSHDMRDNVIMVCTSVCETKKDGRMKRLQSIIRGDRSKP
jgi:hypothetical protein